MNNLIKAFFSDPHFGHQNIIKYCNRPFDNVEQMNKTMIEKYNAIIGDDDTVMWLGDCFFKGPIGKDVMKQLNGHKILVLGNHDKSAGHMAGLGFDLVMEECFMKIAGRTCRLKHYPYFNSEPKGARKDDRYKDRRPPKVKHEALLHGHTHSKIKKYNNMIHCGVDSWNYSPALYSEVEALVAEI